MRKLAVICLFAFIITGLSCASTQVDTGVKYAGTYRSYKKVVKQWSRTAKDYETPLDTVMHVSATYESKAFRSAFNAEKIRSEALTDEFAQRLIAKSDKELESSAVFFISFYTDKLRYNRLDKTETSWKLWLKDEKGNQVAPRKIERLRKKTFALTQYYPYFDEFSYFYRVHFPRNTPDGKPLQLESGKVTLLVAGIDSRAELVWDIP